MAIAAPLSRFKKNNYLIIIIVIIAASCWLFYDANYNKKFIEDHTREDGTPDQTLVINKKAPPYLLALAALVAVRFIMVKGQKVVAADNMLICGKKTIAYDSIEKIDKTFFDKKGYFTVFYKNDSGQDTKITFSDRNYDNLPAVLDELVRQITSETTS